MFIESLKIESKDGLIRNLPFHPGMNLIVDETPSRHVETGNNVGKTTVLRIIDICLGKSPRSIFVSPEDNKTVNEQVKTFLTEKKVVVTLTLVSNWTDQARRVVIRRNFLNNSQAIREINGHQLQDKDFEQALQESIMEVVTVKPTFRQLISHNIRYTNVAVTQTLRTLEGLVNDTVYEALFLYMLGCDYSNADIRQETMDQLNTERSFKSRLEKSKTRNMLASEQGIVKSEIDELERQKKQLHLNADFEKDMQELNDMKFSITTMAAQLNTLKLRKSILNEAQQDLYAQKSDIDTESLRQIYAQAQKFLPALQHTFEELMAHHNRMLVNKAEFIGGELPVIEEKISALQTRLTAAHQEETALSDKLLDSVSYADYETLITELTQKYERLGSLTHQISQIDEVDHAIETLNNTLADIDKELFADPFQKKVQTQLDKFNGYFARISQQLYGEKYGMVFEIAQNKKTGKDVYKFSIIPIDTDTVNFSSGKKQGEITCFDMAYILFADQENIPCMHFGLYDKKELMHGNQLIETAKFVSGYPNLQFVASILKDKLPEELNDEKYFVVKLSQNDKLFKF